MCDHHVEEKKLIAVQMMTLDATNADLQQRLDAAEDALRVAQGEVEQRKHWDSLVCQRCHGIGEITVISGQTPESFSQDNIACPDCIGPILDEHNLALTAANSRVEELTAEVERHNKWAKDIAKELGCADAAQYRNDALDGIRAMSNRCKPAIANHCSMSVLTRRVGRLREALDGLRLPIGSMARGRYTHWEKSCTARRCVDAIDKALAEDAKEGK